jgi:hypothetical protein
MSGQQCQAKSIRLVFGLPESLVLLEERVVMGYNVLAEIIYGTRQIRV